MASLKSKPAAQASAAQALAPWFGTAFTKMPRPIRVIAAQVVAPFKWRELSPERRRLAAERFDANAADGGAAHTVGWEDATREASHWFSLADVAPWEAAMALSGHKPDGAKLEEAQTHSTDFGGPDVFKKLLRRFEDLAKREPQHRSLRQWLKFAQESKLRYHPWVDEYVEAAGLVATIQTPSDPLPEAGEAPPRDDHSTLATRAQLIAAFGAFTGMNVEWFKKLKDTPALLKARKVDGVGARGKTREPLFCPVEVMLWLSDTKRKKGRPFHSVGKPWDLLERHFPNAYEKHSKSDPREERTG
jgi:hypothetical protein